MVSVYRLLILLTFILFGCGARNQADDSSFHDVYDKAYSSGTSGYYYWVEDRKLFRTTCLPDKEVWTRATCPLYKKSLDAKTVFDQLLATRQLDYNQSLTKRGEVMQRFSQVTTKMQGILDTDSDSQNDAEIKRLLEKKTNLQNQLTPFDIQIGDLQTQVKTMSDDYASTGNLELLRQIADLKEKITKLNGKAQQIRDDLASTMANLYARSSQVMDNEIFKQLLGERTGLVAKLEIIDRDLEKFEWALNGVYRVYKLLEDNSFAYIVKDNGGGQLFYDLKVVEDIRLKFTELETLDQLADYDVKASAGGCENNQCVFIANGIYVHDGRSNSFPRSARNKGSFTCTLIEPKPLKCSTIEFRNNRTAGNFFMVFKKAFNLDSDNKIDFSCDDWSKTTCATKLKNEGADIAMYYRDRDREEIDMNNPVLLPDGLVGVWDYRLTCENQQPFKPILECTFEVE